MINKRYLIMFKAINNEGVEASFVKVISAKTSILARKEIENIYKNCKIISVRDIGDNQTLNISNDEENTDNKK